MTTEKKGREEENKYIDRAKSSACSRGTRSFRSASCSSLPSFFYFLLPSPPLLPLVQYVKRKGELHKQQQQRRRRHQTITYCTTAVVAVQLSSSIQSFVRLPYANATTLLLHCTTLHYTVCVCVRATHTNDGRCRGFKFESTFHYVQSALPPRDLFISSLSGAATTTRTPSLP